MERKSVVSFAGAFVVASWEYRQQPDRNGQMRQAIVFHLTPTVQAGLDQPWFPAEELSLLDLRRRAQASGADAPEAKVSDSARTVLARSRDVVAYALARAAGICESCDHVAPFVRLDGRPYLEVHHMNRLTDGGPDMPEAVAALCPNCHRQVHYACDGAALNDKLQSRIAVKEAALS
jgi:5-methylcytosine-specific restriction protein A